MKYVLCTIAFSSLAVAAGCTVESAPAPGPSAAISTGTGTGDGGGTSGEGGASSGEGGGDTSTGQGGDGGGEPLPEVQGYVFTMSNAEAGNELVVFEREEDGSLGNRFELPTGGFGSGNGLGSQGALTVSDDGEYLYVVNAGSNQLSSFRIYADHLALVDLVASGGERPVSVTARDGLVYVVNAGGDGVVQGFTSDQGMLTPIAAAHQPLSAASSGPAQIGLTPDGDALIVTEKATNQLVTYWVAPDGSLSAGTPSESQGVTPFGFDFGPTGTLIVSEAHMGMETLSTASSYTIGSVAPEVISGAVPSNQTAACWLLVAQGSFAYTTNTASNTISGYQLHDDGSITLFDDDGVTADLGDDQGPLDMALADDDSVIYVLNGASDSVTGFHVELDGSLTAMNLAVDVPENAFGLAAR